jgi:NhaP-type Na+/H+ or K+/H+ antiporter
MSTPFFGFLLAAGLLAWLLGLYSARVKMLIAPPVVITLAGLMLSRLVPASRELLLPWLETAAWVAVGFGVTSLSLRFSGAELRRIWRPGALITFGAMLGMWALSGLVLGLFFDLPFDMAMLIGAIVTPTDPVIASSIVSGRFAERHVPHRVRQVLAFESGGNDGIALAFVLLPMLLLERGGAAWGEWILEVLLYKVVVGGALGAALGWLAAAAFNRAVAAGLAKSKHVLLASLTFTVVVLPLAKLASLDSIWAAFFAGLVFSVRIGGDQRSAADTYQDGAAYLVMVPAMLLYAMALPWDAWRDFGAWGVAAVATLLLARRLPVIGAIYAASRKGWVARGEEIQAFRAPRDGLFYGWFGPIGMSTLFYATLAQRHLHDERIWAIASLCVFGSVLAHGLTAAPFTEWYGSSQARERNLHKARHAAR